MARGAGLSGEGCGPAAAAPGTPGRRRRPGAGERRARASLLGRAAPGPRGTGRGGAGRGGAGGSRGGSPRRRPSGGRGAAEGGQRPREARDNDREGQRRGPAPRRCRSSAKPDPRPAAQGLAPEVLCSCCGDERLMVKYEITQAGRWAFADLTC